MGKSINRKAEGQKAEKKAVALITEENLNNQVLKGGKKKGVKEDLENYLRSQFNALYLTSNVATFQLKVNDVIKQFLVISENKINASSYDLNGIIQEVIFTLATEYKENGEKRIPCIKANNNKVAILMTCDVSKYDVYFEKNIKAETSKKAREEKKAEKQKEEAEKTEEQKIEEFNEINTNNEKKATLCIMSLIAKYGASLDLESIKIAIAEVETEGKEEENNPAKESA